MLCPRSEKETYISIWRSTPSEGIELVQQTTQTPQAYSLHEESQTYVIICTEVAPQRYEGCVLRITCTSKSITVSNSIEASANSTPHMANTSTHNMVGLDADEKPMPLDSSPRARLAK
mmetsp:Transcript_17165/g.27217  ORF Transcript_17165/g.27217 Transcript_17165/m.27217 type:complete len:118 (+) Transcript_17165:53-406(+)